MIKLIQKITYFTLLSMFSTASFANSPWAQEESSPIARSDAEPTVQETAEQPEASSPAYMQDQVDTSKQQDVEVTTEVKTTGDVMTMPTARSSRVILLDFPRRGMTTDKVENELGRPVDIVPAVGTPPISRWVYDDRVVFFEGSSVIHVVAK